MKIGFTGTRNGMTEQQKRTVALLVERFKPTEAHHGDCVGADAEFHEIVRREVPTCRIVGHPGPDGPLRAHCKVDELRPEKPYLVRNHDIVDETEALLGTPGEAQEKLKSGTWATIRYARKQKRPSCTVHPNGEDHAKDGFDEMRWILYMADREEESGGL